MASIGPEGGIVSTVKDFFIKAISQCHLFPKEDLEELYLWKIVFNPGYFLWIGFYKTAYFYKKFRSGITWSLG